MPNKYVQILRGWAKKEIFFSAKHCGDFLTRIDRAYVVNNDNIITQELMASRGLHTWNN